MELFPYQKDGAEWLATNSRRHLLLADEPGLGKTGQTIAAADTIAAQSILVVCPAVARFNWENEIRRFSEYPRTVNVLVSFSDLPIPGAVNICSYEYASHRKEWLFGVGWDLVVADEAHFANNPDAFRTKALFGKDGLVHKAARFWALTGTPVGNDWGELWVLLFVFGLTTLSYQGFILRYCECILARSPKGPPEYKIVRGKTEMVGELRELVARIMLRRKKMDVLKDLPPISFEDYVVEAGPIDFDTDASLIGYVFPHDRRDEFFEKLNAETAMVEALLKYKGLGEDGLGALSALADSTPTLRRFVGLSKVQGAGDLLEEELKSGALTKVVVFAIHQGVIEGLRKRLNKYGAVTLYGKTPPEKRALHIEKFQTNPKCRVFILNIKAAGTAINLTAASQVLFVEQEWNPTHNAQAAMRCHRIGQKEPVFVRFLAVKDSIDQRVAQVLKRKTRDALTLLG